MTGGLTVIRRSLPPVLALSAAAVGAIGGAPWFEVVALSAVGALAGVLFVMLSKAATHLAGHEAPPPPQSGDRERLLRHDKRRLIRAIKDIELDKALGRVSVSEAKQLVAPLRSRAVEVLRELDQLLVEQRDELPADSEATFDARLARALARHRKVGGAS